MTQRPGPRKPSRIGWYLLLGVIGLYGLAFLVAAPVAHRALGAAARTLHGLIPVLGLIFVLLVLFDRLVKAEWLRRRLGTRAGPGGWLLAIAAGVISVGPIYAWYGLLRELRSHGVRTGLLVAFLYSRAIKLPLLPLMIHYFGATYTVVLSGYILIFAGLNGLLAERLLDRTRRV